MKTRKRCMKERILAWLCAAMMILTSMPITAKAAEPAELTLSVAIDKDSAVVGEKLTAVVSAVDADGQEVLFDNYKNHLTYEWTYVEDKESMSNPSSAAGNETCTAAAEAEGKYYFVTVSMDENSDYVLPKDPQGNPGSVNSTNYVYVKKTPNFDVNITGGTGAESEPIYQDTLTANVTTTDAALENELDGVTYEWYKAGDDTNPIGIEKDFVNLTVGESYYVKVIYPENDTYTSGTAISSTIGPVGKKTPDVTVTQNPTSVAYGTEVKFDAVADVAGKIVIDGQQEKSLSLNSESGKYELSDYYSIGVKDATDDGKAAYSFVPADEANYESVSDKVSYVVSQVTFTGASVKWNEKTEGTVVYSDTTSITLSLNDKDEGGKFTFDLPNDAADGYEDLSASIENDTLKVDISTWDASDTSYEIKWKYTPNDGINYNEQYGTVKVTVDPKPLDFKFTVEKIYDGTSEVAEAEISDLVFLNPINGLMITAGDITLPVDCENVTDKSVQAGIDISNLSISSDKDAEVKASNYVLGSYTAKIIVNPKTVKVTGVSFTDKVYDATSEVKDRNAVYTFDELVPDDELAIEGGITYKTVDDAGEDDKSAGTKKVEPAAVTTDSVPDALTLSSVNYRLDESTDTLDEIQTIITDGWEINVTKFKITVSQSSESLEKISDGKITFPYDIAEDSKYYVVEATVENTTIPDTNLKARPIANATDNAATADWVVSSTIPGAVDITGVTAGDFKVFAGSADLSGNYEISVELVELAAKVNPVAAKETTFDLSKSAVFEYADGKTITFAEGSPKLVGQDTEYWYKAGDSITVDSGETLWKEAGGVYTEFESEDYKYTGSNICENVFIKTADEIFYGPVDIEYYYDAVIPELTVIEVETYAYQSDDLIIGNWTDGVKYTVTVGDNNSGIKGVQWAVTSTKEATPDSWKSASIGTDGVFQIKAPATGYLSVRAEDYAGNTSEISQYRALVLEGDAPALTVEVDNVELDPNAQPAQDFGYKKSHIFIFTADDAVTDAANHNYSGIHKVVYKLSNASGAVISEKVINGENTAPTKLEDVEEVHEKSISEAVTISVDDDGKVLNGEYTLTVTAYDFCGNTSTLTQTLHFDNTVPEAELSLTGSNKGTDDVYYYNAADGGITVTFKDARLDDGGTYSVVITNNEEVYLKDITENVTATLTEKTITIPASTIVGWDDGTYTITVTAKDAAGNALEALNESSGVNADGMTATFVLDKTAPVAKVTMSGGVAEYKATEGYYYRADNCGITVDFSDTNLAAGGTYKVIVDGMATEVPAGEGNAQATIGKDTVSKLEDGKRTITVTATDIAGNVMTVLSNESSGVTLDDDQASFILDTVSPTAVITYTALGGTHLYDSNVNAYYNTEFTANIKFDDVYMDKEKLFTAWTKDNDTVTYSQLADSLLAGENKVSYKVVADAADHTTDGIYKVSVYGADKAGNPLKVTEYVTTAGGAKQSDEPVSAGPEAPAYIGKNKIMDTTAPEAVITFTELDDTHIYEDNLNAYYNKDMTAAFAFSDTNLDLEKVFIAQNKDETEGVYADADATTVNLTVEADNSTDGIYTYYVYGTDKAGNKLLVTEYVTTNASDKQADKVEAGDESTKYATKNKIMDTDSPTAVITYTELGAAHIYDDNENAYYKDSFEAAIDFADINLDETKLFTAQTKDEVTAVYEKLNVNYASGVTSGIKVYTIAKQTAQAGDNDGIYKFYAYGVDKAGNPLKVTEYVTTADGAKQNDEPISAGDEDTKYTSKNKILDTIAPTYTSEITPLDLQANPDAVDSKNTSYFNKDVKVTFAITETNFDNSMIKAEVTELALGEKGYYECTPVWKEIALEPGSVYTYNKNDYTKTITEDGVYRFEIAGQDKAGNLLVPSNDEAAKIDHTATMQVGADADGCYWTYNIVRDTVAPAINLDMFVGENKIFAAKLEALSKDKLDELAEEEKDPLLATSENKPYQQADKATATISTTDSSPTTLEYEFKTTKAKADLNNEQMSVGYGAWNYYGETPEDYNNYIDSIKFEGQQTIELTVLKAKDRAGNEVVVGDAVDGSKINKIYLDTQIPGGDKVGAAVDLSYPSRVSTVSGGRGPEGNPLYKGNVVVTAHVEDPYGDIDTQYASSGLYKVYYQVLVGGTVRNGNTVSVKSSKGTVNQEAGEISYGTSGSSANYEEDQKNEKLTYEDTMTFTFDPAANSGLFNNNDIEIRVWVEDNAGNGGKTYADNTSRSSYKFGIDTTNPVIKVTYNNNRVSNERYFKEDRTATIVVYERNFDARTTTISTESGAVISGWSFNKGDSVNGDNDAWICNVTYATDGDYTFGFSTIDRVGHTSAAPNYGDSAAPTSFTIDKTVPVIEVVFDNNDVRNGRYYNSNRTAAIYIAEHNFRSSDVVAVATAAIAEGNVAAPGLGGWTRTNDTNRSSMAFNQDGDYTLRVEYTDLAGNAAQVQTVSMFTIDTTAPTLVIGGVEDYAAYNGEVAPSITYHDINYDNTSANISITGYNHKDGSNLAGTRTDTAFGGSFVCDNIEAVRENDDIYTATGTVSDLAGNVSEARVVFSVNRFGSTYMLGDATRQLVEDNFTNVSPILEVIEINVSPLVNYQITTSLNGEINTLSEGSDYTVSSENPGWYQYNYIINASNFEKEGAYMVTLLSEDEAQNSNTNHAIKENGGRSSELDIAFTVDKTAPAIVIAGVDHEEQYVDTERIITVYYDDNCAVTELTIYADGKPVAIYTAEQLGASGELTYIAMAKNSWQEFRVAAIDAAGNKSSDNEVTYLLTDNLFVQWYSNKPIFLGTIGGIAFITILAAFLIRRRMLVAAKEEEE